MRGSDIGGGFAPIDANHTHVWRFTETSGATCAAAKGGLDLTLSGSEGTNWVRGVPWGAGEYGTYFPGSSTVAAAATAGADLIPASATPAFTLEALALTYDITVTQGICCLTTGSADEEQYIAFALGVDGSSRIGGSNVDIVKAVGYLGLMHLMLVRTATTLSFYLNGGLIGTAAETRAIPAGYDTIRIGNIQRDYPLRGVVFEVRLSDIARDAAYARAASLAAMRI